MSRSGLAESFDVVRRSVATGVMTGSTLRAASFKTDPDQRIVSGSGRSLFVRDTDQESPGARDRPYEAADRLEPDPVKVPALATTRDD